MRSLARHAIPAAALLLPGGFFLSVLSPEATEPNALIWLAYAGAVSLVAGLLTLGVGLIRRGASGSVPQQPQAPGSARQVGGRPS